MQKQDLQQNMPGMSVEEYSQKIMNIIRDVIKEPETHLAEYQSVMTELFNTMSLGHGVKVLERISSQIKGLAQYKNFLMMFSSGILFGKNFADFTDPNEISAAAINSLINFLPGAYQEILLYPRTE